MPRGRHRHSPPLHRLLPPSTVAGVSLVCAAAAWLVAEPVVLRGLVGAAAAAAVVGSVVMRRWDRVAGKRVAELTRARASDEWKHEEHTAELESDLEESREVRAKLEVKLRAKRTELAALRSEHAALLRRYATAETERASALEGRRRLAIEASAPARALPAGSAGSTESAVDAGNKGDAGNNGDAGSNGKAVNGGAPSGSSAQTPSPALYRRANAALEHLMRGGVPGDLPAQRGTGQAGDAGDAGGSGAAREGAEAAQGKPGAADAELRPAAVSQAPRHYPVPAAAAAAVVPYTPVRRTVGGFDFFGTKSPEAEQAVRDEVRAIENKDLADVVGEEALALHRAEVRAAEQVQATAQALAVPSDDAVEDAAEDAAGDVAEDAAEDAAPEAEFTPVEAVERAVGEVIDLTAHDETEQLDLADLRTAIS
ncbi:hypothetical protein [Streptomyces cavernicola]|uniref:Secreted protein n=1 Tax=Streptomyces cavernicola TaxID=3043613 RepID=A0ABT6SF42_9ACTN|nr:hypothetical protein [Streptomyces sp. B-S-A6]MDI3406798.1 hypothetical protein [Streptomyces sp. B-S-A6]